MPKTKKALHIKKMKKSRKKRDRKENKHPKVEYVTLQEVFPLIYLNQPDFKAPKKGKKRATKTGR